MFVGNFILIQPALRAALRRREFLGLPIPTRKAKA
jgi:hypothetical protein